MNPPTAPRWVLLVYAGLALAVAGIELASSTSTPTVRLVVAAILAAAVALAGRLPSAALGLIVVMTAAQALSGTEAQTDELVLAVVTFSCARYGRAATAWASGAYIPVAYLVGGMYAVNPWADATTAGPRDAMGQLPSVILFVVGVVAPLAVPWLVGIALRMRQRASESRASRVRAESERAMAVALQERAEEIAQAQESRAELARDVHDVVGHSLAVILAQAESASFLDAEMPAPVGRILRTIADAARESLDDVRAVLTEDTATTRFDGNLDDVVRSLPESVDLTDEVVGTPRPLPPDVGTAAARILQEMLANALKHGRPGHRVTLIRDWTHGLSLAVGNSTASDERGAGMGLTNMRRRAESAGGRLTVTDGDGSFAVTAWLPTGGPRSESGA